MDSLWNMSCDWLKFSLVDFLTQCGICHFVWQQSFPGCWKWASSSSSGADVINLNIPWAPRQFEPLTPVQIAGTMGGERVWSGFRHLLDWFCLRLHQRIWSACGFRRWWRSEASGWSPHRETWSCSVTAWPPTRTSKVTTANLQVTFMSVHTRLLNVIVKLVL